MKQLDDCYFDFVDLRISRFWSVFSGSMDVQTNPTASKILNGKPIWYLFRGSRVSSRGITSFNVALLRLSATTFLHRTSGYSEVQEP